AGCGTGKHLQLLRRFRNCRTVDAGLALPPVPPSVALGSQCACRPAVGDALNQLCGSRHDPGLAPFPALSRPAPTFSLVRRILPVTARSEEHTSELQSRG